MPFKIDYCHAIDCDFRNGWYCARIAEAQQRLIAYPPQLRIRYEQEKGTEK